MARTRSTVLVPVLLVLLVISSVLAVLGLWSARQFLRDDSWETMSGALIADPAIQAQVADQVTAAIVDATDVEATLQGALPPRLQPLAAPAAVALRDGTRRVVLRGLRAPKVQRAWKTAVVATQRQAINLIEDDGVAVRLPGGGGVIIDLRPLTGQVAADLGLPASVIDRLPEERTRIRIVRGDALQEARSGLKWFKRLVVLFLVLVPLLAAATIAASPVGRRRRAAIAVACAVGFAGLLVLAFRRIAGQQLESALADGGPAGPAVASVWDISTSLMTQIAGGGLLIAAVLLVGGLLAGPSRPAVRVRRPLEPALASSALGVHAAVVAVGVAAVAVGLVPFIERPLGLVLLLLSLVTATEFVRRAAADEPLAADQPVTGEGAESGGPSPDGEPPSSLGSEPSAASPPDSSSA